MAGKDTGQGSHPNRQSAEPAVETTGDTAASCTGRSCNYRSMR